MKKSKIIIITLISIFSVLLIGYISMTIFNSSRFQKNTYINGEDYSFCTVDEVKEKLNSKMSDYAMEVTLKNGSFTIKPEDIDLSITADNDIIKAKDTQNAFLWFKSFFTKHEYVAYYNVSYNNDKLNNYIKNLSYFKPENMTEPTNATVEIKDGKPIIVECSDGTTIDYNMAIKLIDDNIKTLTKSVSLDECYIKAEYDKDSDKVKEFFNTIQSYLSLKINYVYTENVNYLIDSIDIYNMIDINNKTYTCTINKDKVKEYVDKFADEHDTFGKDRLFKTTDGKTVKVTNDYFGWKIDRESEVEELYKDLLNKKDVTREPIFSEKSDTYSYDNYDIGDSYVEFDLTNQKVHFYMNGKKILSDDIISGNPNRYQNTPGGLYKIYSMSYDVILSGPGYASHVDYWMPFNGEIGMHDAHWQSKFGGDLYLSRGSHGCVNLPYKTAETIWDMGYIGLPVVCYWRNDNYLVD